MIDPDSVAGLEDVLRIERSLDGPLCSPETSTYTLLRDGAAIDPAAPALSFFLRTEDHARPFVWSHAAWLADITRTATMLRRLGVGRGDVVASLLPNLPEAHLAFWGAEAAGIAFPVNPLLSPALLASLLRVAEARVLVTLGPAPGTDLWQKTLEIVPQVPSLRAVLTVDPARYVRGAKGAAGRVLSRVRTRRRIGSVTVVDFGRKRRKAPADGLGFAAPKRDDVASYIATGGTTGTPKIAVRTHGNEAANARAASRMLGKVMAEPGRTVLCGLPLFHVNALIASGLVPFSKGGHVLLATPQGYRAPGLLARFWEIVEHHKVAIFSGVPTVYSTLLTIPRAGRDLSSLIYGVCGAAPLPRELFRRFEAETGITLLEGYGLTEGACVSSLNPPAGQSRIGSIGVRLPWQEMRVLVLDADGVYLRDAHTDEAGAIAIRGPHVFNGYLIASQNEGLWIDRPSGSGGTERWLNTGDLGREDADGFFYLSGRKKELIIRGGHNIDPRMIEEALGAHEAVALVAAIGRPDAHAGEIPVAYVQPRPGLSVDEATLIGFAQERIEERAAWPKRIIIVETLPITAIGKIFKPELAGREILDVLRLEAQEAGVVLAWSDIVADPKDGQVVRWAAAAEATGLERALGRYGFRNRRCAVAAGGQGQGSALDPLKAQP